MIESYASEPAAKPDILSEAYMDVLTRLPNRRAFGDSLEQAVNTAPGNCGVVFIDLDGLKAANDSSADGHSGGDRLIMDTATVLRGQTRQDEANQSDGQADMVARLGGDEFGVLVHEVKTEIEMHLVGTRLQQVLEEHGIKSSVGTALHALHESASEVLARADKAMYEDKRSHNIGNLSREQLRGLVEIDDLLADYNLDPRTALAAIDALRRRIRNN